MLQTLKIIEKKNTKYLFTQNILQSICQNVRKKHKCKIFVLCNKELRIFLFEKSTIILG